MTRKRAMVVRLPLKKSLTKTYAEEIPKCCRKTSQRLRKKQKNETTTISTKSLPTTTVKLNNQRRKMEKGMKTEISRVPDLGKKKQRVVKSSRKLGPLETNKPKEIGKSSKNGKLTTPVAVVSRKQKIEADGSSKSLKKTMSTMKENKPKKRGRKPKPESVVENRTPRPRGRPRNSDTAAFSKKTPTLPQTNDTVPRPRGRPRGSGTTATSKKISTLLKTIPTVPRRRGRPPGSVSKNKKTTSSKVSSNRISGDDDDGDSQGQDLDYFNINVEEEDYFVHHESEDDDFMIGGDDDDESDRSEVEDILEEYDNEGILKPKENDEKLPSGFQIRNRRFKSSYVPPAISLRDLFTKAEAMSRRLGKKDYEQRLIRQVVTTSDEFVRDHIDPSYVQNEMRIHSGLESIMTSLKKWFYQRDSDSSELHPIIPDMLENLTKFCKLFIKKLKIEVPNNDFRTLAIVKAAQNVTKESWKRLYSMHLHCLDLELTTEDWLQQLEATIAEKSTIIDYLFLYKKCIIATPPEFDETSNWGLKPLRDTFLPPYFKDWKGRVVAPEIFKKSSETKLTMLLTTNKQKWTIRDIKCLETCIRIVVLEKKLFHAQRFKDTMLMKFHDLQAEKRDDIVLERVKEKMKNLDLVGRNRRVKKQSFKKFGSATLKISSSLAEYEKIGLGTTTTAREVRSWYNKEIVQINKLKYKNLFDNGSVTAETIDWDLVSAKIMHKTKKLRLPEDCKKCFQHGANPTLQNRRRWAGTEKEILELEAKAGISWSEISAETGRPEFAVFYKWRNTTSRFQKMIWTNEKDKELRLAVEKSDANWNQVVSLLSDSSATKNNAVERFKKSQNSILRFGKFTRVEDALMMLTIEKLKGHFGREKHFGILTAYLPWRYESAWRDRAENLFAEYIVPWTLQEDEKLMTLAISMKRDWSKIAQEFTSFKTRKGCLTRFKILEKRMTRFLSLEDYHHSYAMIRYNVREYRHLKDIGNLLKEIMKLKQYSFQGLLPNRPPTETELQDLILSFDRDVMASTIRVIETYMVRRDEYWNEWRMSNGIIHGEKRRTHDRRTFHPDSMQSIASALHIRGVKLIGKETLTFELSQKEKEIYKFYAQFCSTKPLKQDKERPYIPQANKLLQLPNVKRIVQHKFGHIEDNSIILQPPSKKFKTEIM